MQLCSVTTIYMFGRSCPSFAWIHCISSMHS